ncbi:glycosyl hydrolase family 28-related protein [Shimia sp.]|uniref:glycosyl hydrolase family 28-related protein n=1 Tax=Shimia sp. TaxID=1954381 RepID=UPI003BAC9105
MQYPHGGAAEIFRDGSGHNPSKAEIRDWGQVIEGGVGYLMLSVLLASSHTYDDGSIVRTLEEGFAYRAVASGGHITNAGGQAFEVLPFRSGAYNLKAFGAVGDGVADDTAPTQAAINACANDEYVLVPRGLYRLTAPVAMKSRVSMECGGKWSAGFFGDFNGPLFYSTTQMWRNAFRNIQFRNNHDGPLVACLSYTGYQSMVQECRFECHHGKAIALNGQGYSVENKIRDCYFYGCRYGIYAVTGTHANTDAWVIDNYFYGNGRQVNAIYWETPSGGVFRGNHPYGGTLNGHYFEFVAGLNVSVLDNYFEDDTEPRIKIQLGNPSSYIIGGNKFWQGDGSGTDANGNKQSLIELECAPGVPQVVGLNGNIFEAGENSVDILRTNIDVGNEAFKTVDINLSGNVYNGSYNLGTNTQRVVETDWLGLAKAHTDQNPLIGVSSSIERYTFDGAGTGTPGLPNNTILEGKSFKLRNEGRALLTLSTARVVKGSKKIPPFSEFQISMIDGEYFVLGAPTPLPPTELSVAAGSVDVSRSYHTLDTEANAATDDLFSMTGGHDGMRVLLRAADNARTVTLKDGGGNLRLNGDFALDTVVDAIELIYDASLSLWVEISRSDNA